MTAQQASVTNSALVSTNATEQSENPRIREERTSMDRDAAEQQGMWAGVLFYLRMLQMLNRARQMQPLNSVTTKLNTVLV